MSNSDSDSEKKFLDPTREALVTLQEELRLLKEEKEALTQRVEERTQALELASKAAEVANQSKNQFIANMSHEMRTPLAAILGYAELMYDSKQTVTERLNCIGRIRQNLRNLTDLVDDILDLAKVEAGGTEILPVTFSLLPELGEIFSSLETQAWKKRLSFDLSFEGPIPETISTDASRFRQILTNIISNAIKFTERGGVGVMVRLSTDEDDSSRHKLCFIVNDTGCGISPSQADTLFQPFVQGDGSLTRAYGGTGLGLALARRLARTLRGDVALTRTQPERGSTFTVTVDPGPLEGVRMFDRVGREDLNVRQPAPPVWGDRKLEGMRVLLVEDAPDIQLLVSHFLRRSGAVVDVANDGHEGIRKAKTGCFDLVLMDLQMPVLNGYEATAQLQKEGFQSPIVALTAHAMKGVKERCLQAGCDDYLTKPINAAALLDLIHRYYRKPKVKDLAAN
jgi:signal transduction histidine kinase/ActR/RegA family two-component response regulator